MAEDTNPLCCCEYENVHGERAHLCGLLCDCAEIDDAFDKVILGGKMPPNRMESILEVVEDRLRLPWPKGAIKVPIDRISPWLLVPLLFRLASGSWLTQVIVHGTVLPLVIFCKYKTCLRSYRPETKFFVSWSAATFAYIFYVYQVQVVGFFRLPKTVSPLENLCLMGFLVGAIYSVYKAKTYNHAKSNGNLNEEPKYCKICSTMIPGKDHHCIWIDACISRGNMKYFLAFLAFIFVSLVDAGLILLTSVCLPLSEVGPFILIPDKWCQRWNTHFEGDIHITWTAGLHCFLLSAPILCLFIAKVSSTYLFKNSYSTKNHL